MIEQYYSVKLPQYSLSLVILLAYKNVFNYHLKHAYVLDYTLAT